MKALTVKGDLADAIIRGEKRVENRSWGKSVRGTIAIHRGGPGGAIIGLVDVVDVVTPRQAKAMLPRKQWKHICGPLCWILSNPIPVIPVRIPGKLFLWKVPDDIASKMRAR